MDGDEAQQRHRQGIAVALKADPTSGLRDSARPSIVASGRGRIAEQILRIAFDRGIRVREDQELAEILVAVDVNSPIPLQALATVAEILAYLYQSRDVSTRHGAEA